MKYADRAEVDVVVESSGSGVKFNFCDALSLRRAHCLDLNDLGAKIQPHAVDLFFCAGVTGGDIDVVNQVGYGTVATTSLSDWFSGITCVGSSRMNLTNLKASAGTDAAMTRSVGMSLLSCRDSNFSNVAIAGYTSVNLEIGACDALTVSNYVLDGRYQTTTLWPTEFQNGEHFTNNGFYPDFTRGLKANAGVQMTNGVVKRMLGAGFNDYISWYCTHNSVRFVGNQVGAIVNGDNVSGGFGVENLVGRERRFIGCDFVCNETVGLVNRGSTDLRLDGCNLTNNGQAKTAVGAALRLTGVYAATAAGYFGQNGGVLVDRVRTRMRGCLTHDTQTVTTSKGSSSPTAPTRVSVWNPGLYEYGQTITLVGCGVAGADLVTQVRDLDGDELVVANALSTFPSAAGAGTISTAGTVLTGAGTAFLSAIQGRTFIVNGGNYRRIVAVTTDTAAVLELAFPANLAGAAYSIVTFNAAQIRSQEWGLATSSAARDLTLRVDSHDFGAGNLVGNSNLALEGSIREVGPQPIVFSSADLEANAGTPAVGNIGGGRRTVWLLDAVATESMQAEVYVPPAYGVRVRATLVWSNAGAGAGDVVWNLGYFNGADATNLNAIDAGGANFTVTAPAQDVQKNSVVPTDLVVVPGSILYVRIQRTATDAADTLANDAALIAVILTPVG